MALNKKQKIGIGIGIALALGLGIYFISKAVKRAKSKKECEKKGGTWDAKTKTCKLPPAPLQDVIAKVYDNLTFATNSATILSKSFPYLREMANYLKSNPSFSMKITGHTDNVGNDAYNLDLSRRRAESVKNFLVKEGVGEIMLTTDGKGETEPIADNNTAQGRELNRRVVFEVTKVQEEPLQSPQQV